MKNHASSRRKAFVEDYLAALLAQASHTVAAQFHRTVRQYGLLVPEWRILASLAGGAAIPIGRLAELTVAQQPTVTRQLDRMQQRGLVERVAHAADRRVTLAVITPAGQRLADLLIARALEHERTVLAPLGSRRAAELKRVLRDMAGGQHANSSTPARSPNARIDRPNTHA
jgi:DNA-binding MarR family transcriptional regulator